MTTLKRFTISLLVVLPLAFTAVSAKAKDIVDTAISAGQFGTLVAAVQAAGLVDVLKGTGPFTVFAPTDEAFAALPEGTVENLLKPENKDSWQLSSPTTSYQEKSCQPTLLEKLLKSQQCKAATYQSTR